MVKFELKRQLFHLFFGIAIVMLLYAGIIGKWILFYSIILGFIISVFSKKINIPTMGFFLKNFEREVDLKKFPGKGILMYLIGCFLVLLFFDLKIALSSIMILALGDSFSTIFGIRYGKTKHMLNNKKFLEGSIAGLTAGFLGAMIFVRWYEALIASFLAMVSEAIEIKIGSKQINDNVIIPIVAGFSIWAFRLI